MFFYGQIVVILSPTCCQFAFFLEQSIHRPPPLACHADIVRNDVAREKGGIIEPPDDVIDDD